MKMKLTKLALAGFAVIALAVLPAKANTIEYSLSAFNIAGYTGPFGNVDVNLTDSTHATITFTGLNGYQLIDHSIAAVNLNATSFTETIGGGDTDFSGFDLSNGTVDGWGSFNLIVDNQTASSHFSTISFSVVNTGSTWADAANVLVANALGNVVAAHLITPVDNNPTGFASGGDTPSVPDGGATVALLGFGLAGVGVASRKFRKT
jgi:hypothetical protein